MMAMTCACGGAMATKIGWWVCLDCDGAMTPSGIYFPANSMNIPPHTPEEKAAARERIAARLALAQTERRAA